MQVGLTGDDRPRCAKVFSQPGIVRSYSVQVAVEMHTATCGCAGQVETVLDRNGQSPKWAAAVAKPATRAARHGLDARCFRAGPFLVLPKIGIASGIPIGMGKGLVCQNCGLQSSTCKCEAKAPDGPRTNCHKEIVTM